MDTGKKKIIAVFFSLGVSLRVYQQKGHLDRYKAYFKALRSVCDELCLFTYGYREEKFFDDPAIRVFEMPYRFPNTVYAFLMPFIYRKQLRNVSLLHTIQMSGALPALVAKAIIRKPLLVQCGYSWSQFARYAHEAWWRRIAIGIVERSAFKNATTIIVTEETQAVYARRFAKKDAVYVVPNSVDIEKFKPCDVKKLNRIVFVGRLAPQKNLFSLVESFSLMRDTVLGLDIVGSGPQEKSLRQMAERLKVRISFLGNVSNDALAEILPRYKALVLPSLYEGDPKVLLEAMAAGVPVIASNVAGTKELIRDRVTGFLCGLTPREIADTITNALRDEDVLAKVSREARAYIETERDFGKNSVRHLEIVKTLLP